jgi:hypothetical protein
MYHLGQISSLVQKTNSLDTNMTPMDNYSDIIKNIV